MVMEVEGDEKFHEKAAQRFAGAFLMPAEALWSNVGRHRRSIGWGELFVWKQLFGASVQAITYAVTVGRAFALSNLDVSFRKYDESSDAAIRDIVFTGSSYFSRAVACRGLAALPWTERHRSRGNLRAAG